MAQAWEHGDGRGGTAAQLARLPQQTVLACASSPILAIVVCWKSRIIGLADTRAYLFFSSENRPAPFPGQMS